MAIISSFPGGIGSGGGIPIGPVTNIATLASSEKAYIKWTDPKDIVVEGVMLAEWGGTTLVRKAGSIPTNQRDGTVILSSTVRDEYTSTYFCDSGLVNNETYYYKFFPFTTGGTYTNDEENEFSIIPTAQVEGIENWKVTDITASTEAGDGKINITWTDPAESILSSDGMVLATWASTNIIVREVTSVVDDGDGIVFTHKVTTRNQHVTSPFTITGLVNGTEYIISILPETVGGGICYDESQKVVGIANRITITEEPIQSNSLTYTGNTQSPTWDNLDSDKVTIGGVLVGVNAGTYEATFVPNTDYRWDDGSTEAKAVNWAIAKTEGSVSLSATSIALNSSTKTATFTVTRAGDGDITITSSNTGVATVSFSGDTVTVSSVNDTSGSATITVSVAEGTNYKDASTVCSVTATFAPTVSTSAKSGVSYTSGISGLDAPTVSLIAKTISSTSSITNTTTTVYYDHGDIHRKISVGNQVTLALNGTNYVFDIIGFNHDTLTTATAYGSSTATGKAGITFQMHDCYATNYIMSNDSAAYWTTSTMRTSTLVTMKSYLPSAWGSIIKTVNKTFGWPRDNGYMTISENCFLLSVIEVTGYQGRSFPNEGSQYAYYKAGNSQAKKRNGSGAVWWTRSPDKYYYDQNYYCYIGASGGNDNSYIGGNNGYSMSFAFCV